MDQLTALPEAGPEAPKQGGATRAGWVLVAVVWAFTLAIVGTLFWVLPRAASSRSLARESFSLRASAAQAQAQLDQAEAQLASVQGELDALDSMRQELLTEAEQNQKQIDALNERIKDLKSEKRQAEAEAAAAAAAAAAASNQGSGGGQTSIPPPPTPPPPPPTLPTP